SKRRTLKPQRSQSCSWRSSSSATSASRGASLTSRCVMPCTAEASAGIGISGFTRLCHFSRVPSGRMRTTAICTMRSGPMRTPVVSRSRTAKGRISSIPMAASWHEKAPDHTGAFHFLNSGRSTDLQLHELELAVLLRVLVITAVFRSLYQVVHRAQQEVLGVLASGPHRVQQRLAGHLHTGIAQLVIGAIGLRGHVRGTGLNGHVHRFLL